MNENHRTDRGAQRGTGAVTGDAATAHEALERIAIADVLYRYAAALDTRDWKLLEQVFAADAAYVMGAYGTFVGPAAIAEQLAWVLGGYDATQHLIANPVAEIDGARARAISNVRAYHHWLADGAARTMEVGGVYRDELVRTPDGWRISHRVLDVTWREGVANLPAASASGGR